MPAVAELKDNRIASCFRHILVATDFSEASRRALSDALALAAQHNAPLSVLHATPPEPALINLESPAELDLGRQVAQRRMKSSFPTSDRTITLRTSFCEMVPSPKC